MNEVLRLSVLRPFPLRGPDPDNLGPLLFLYLSYLLRSFLCTAALLGKRCESPKLSAADTAFVTDEMFLSLLYLFIVLKSVWE